MSKFPPVDSLVLPHFEPHRRRVERGWEGRRQWQPVVVVAVRVRVDILVLRMTWGKLVLSSPDVL